MNNKLLSGCVALLAMLTAVVASAQDFVYVNTPNANNQVYGYSVSAAGALTLVAGPLSTGGTGAYSSPAIADHMVVNQSKALLFVSNDGDHTISVFSINAATGALTAVAGSPFPSGLTSANSTSLATTPDGRYLFAASSSGAINSFAIAIDGSLTQVPGSASFGFLATPSMKVSPNGQFLAAVSSGWVSMYTINLDGTLTQVPGSPFSPLNATSVANTRMEFSCSSDKIYAAQTPSPSVIEGWSVSPTGTLSPIAGSPFTTAAAAYGPDLVLSPDNLLMVQPGAGAANNNVLPFTLSATGSLTSGAAVSGAGFNTAPQLVATNATGSLLYVTDFTNGVAASMAAYTITPDGVIAGGGNVSVLGTTKPFAGMAAFPARSCAAADLALTMTPSATSIAAGTNVTYTITATNNGPSASSFTVGINLDTATIGKFVSCASVGGTCDKGNGLKRAITFTLGSGSSGTVTIVATTVSTLLNDTIVSNTAFIGNGSTFDPNPANNTSTATFTNTNAKVNSTLAVANSTGTYFGNTNLTATLSRTLPTAGVAGRTVNFSINGTPMGSAVTNASGVATLPVSLAGLAVATYTGGITASFAGDTALNPSNGAGNLTVNQAVLTVTADNKTKLYGDPNPPFTYVLTGFVNNETPAVVTGAPGFQTNATTATHAGSSPITPIKGTLAAANYSFTFVQGTLFINPAPLTAAANNVSRAYGDPNPALSGTLTGLLNGDQATVAFSVNANLLSPVGVYPIIGTVTGGARFSATDYTVINTGNLTVTPAPLTAVANSASRIYGDANPAFTGTLSATKNGDVVGFTFSSAATPTSPIGPYPISATLTGPAASNYSVTTTGTLTITPAALSISAANATRKYGDLNPAFTGSIVGIKNNENITATYASVDQTAVVGPYAITPTPVDAGNVLGNYTVTLNNGTLTITPAPLAVSAANASRQYGDPNPSFTGALVGLKNGDPITASFASAALQTDVVATYPIIPSLSDPSGKLSNYTVTSTNGVLTVGAAPLSVAANNASRAYGDANPLFSGTILGIKNSDAISATYASPAVATSVVGSYPIVPTLVDLTGKLSNYTVTTTNGSLNIGAAALVVTPANASRLYGAVNPVFTGSVIGLKNGDAISASFSSTAAATSPVGTYNIVAKLSDPGAKLGNYAVTLNNGTLTINGAPLTVKANNAGKFYGAANPVIGGTILGLKNGDAITATYAATSDATSPVGTYSVVPTLVDPTGKLGNYSVSITNGTMTVLPAVLTVRVNPASRAFGDPNPAFSASFTGIQNNDNITASFTTTAITTSPIGTYPIVATLVDPGAKLSNYTVSKTNGVLTVGAAALTVTPNNASRLYGAANPAFTGTILGLKNGDVITASYSSAATLTSPVGTYSIVATLSDPGNKLVNYSLVSNAGTLTVAPAPLAVKAFNAGKFYGAANPVSSGTVVGLKNGDAITASFSAATDATSAVGAYPIVPTLNDPTGKLGNYAVTLTNGTMNILPVPLTVTADSFVRFVGDSNPAFTGTIVGLKNADNITPAFSTTATVASPIGSYIITPSLVDPTGKAGNYTVALRNGTLTVKARTVTITAPNGGENWVAGSTQAITWTSAGLVGNVNIALLRAGVAVKTIATGVPGSAGVFNWAIPTIQTPGSYTIRVISAADTKIVDVSNAAFSIVAPVSVVAPNGGEIWAAGSSQTITWSAPGVTGNVNIALLKAGVGFKAIASGVPAANGSFTWTLPAVPAGADYTIRVMSATDATIIDVSNAPFTIQ